MGLYHIYGTLSGTNIPGQSGPGSNGKEGVLCTPQIYHHVSYKETPF